MSAVDVLAVMDEAATYVGPDTAALKEARDAVAELIAAANLAAEWIDEAGVRKGLPNVGTLGRLTVALARCNGGAA